MIKAGCASKATTLCQCRHYSDVFRSLPRISKKNKTAKAIEELRSKIRLLSDKSFAVYSASLDSVAPYVALTDYSSDKSQIPGLAHNLESVLFSPGVHYMQDPRTRRFNFSPTLQHIPSIDDFRFDLIAGFVPPARDAIMEKIASEINQNVGSHEKIRYFSSTSSMTNTLKQFHMLLSNFRPCFTRHLSQEFPSTTSFTRNAKSSAFSVVAPKGDGYFSVDSDRSTDTEIALSLLGHELELMLTVEPQEFAKYLKSSPVSAEAGNAENSYQYAKMGNFLMRSQSDARNSDLPGTGIFDLKARAVCAVRHDINFNNYQLTNYEITRSTGLYESFEREIFDLVRTGMWKYSMQARIGNMDGIFVAFHNMRRFFGFQYMPTTELDHIFHGFDLEERESADYNDVVEDIGNHWQTKREALSSFMADFEFKVSMQMWQKVLDKIIKETKGQPFRLITKCVPDAFGPRVEFIATVVDNEMLRKLGSLADEITDLDKEDLAASQGEELPMERIIRMAESRSVQHAEMLKLNKDIIDSTIHDENKCVMFRLTTEHFFNKKLFRGKYPTPPLEILDDPVNNSWTVDYSIRRVYDKRKIKTAYNYYVLEAAMNLKDRPGNRDIAEQAYMDENASHLQRLLRAYSAKSQKRKEIYGV
ncbi:hypothetical protein OGAPHI_004251 [Ogataea philodendri]|uniref:Pet127-domain-containing protein n=1 Tax=Ogataea philodendri TaxID=1378263 RepID=A0A9P8P6B5_9ASCO|nr:uncharacterized protein OGAPHI_004251 [Ogataea philodendri]KAH3666062.1 hypothetical protein OGAPHI_004251 [Ogataea philodendri]